jgi:cytochrome P450
MGAVPGSVGAVTSRPENPPAAGVARDGFPLGAAVRLADLEGELHPVLARLRESEPVSWLPVLNGWLVTRRDLATRVMRDSGTFTVDDPRFSTAQVVGPSMLSLDGAAHDRHRRPFTAPFSMADVHAQLAGFVTAESGRLITAIRPAGAGELRRSLAGPLAVAVVARVLGLGGADPGTILGWYDAIVGAVSQLSASTASAAGADGAPAGGAGLAGAGGGTAAGVEAAGAAAFRQLSDRLQDVISSAAGPSLLAEVARAGQAGASGSGGLTSTEVVSNAAVLMFGGIETTEGMITNALWHLLSHPDQLRLVLDDPGLVPSAVEESLRLEPAAAVVDRYATTDAELGGATIRRGDLVSVSLAGAGRDPAAFADPDRLDIRRDNARNNLAFARGPHFCLGVHLARLEAQAALDAALRLLSGLRLDPEQAAAPRGLVFRKPPALHVRWDVPR